MTNEVTLNAKTIEIGDVLFEGGFEATDNFETKDFYWNELQNGWSISEKTKEDKRTNRRVKFL